VRIAAHRGNRLHVAENTRIAHLSAYTAGADVLEFDVQLTKDGHLVVSHDPTTERLTGDPTPIIEATLADLRKLNVSATFRPAGADDYSYRTAGRRGDEIETLSQLLELLPSSIEKLIELKHDSSLTTGRRDEFVEKAIEALRRSGQFDRVVLYSKDPENLLLARQLEPGLRIAAFDFELEPAAKLELLDQLQADGLVLEINELRDGDGNLTQLANTLAERHANGALSLGAIVYLDRDVAVFSEDEYNALRAHDFVWSLATDSMLDVAAFVRNEQPWLHETFEGRRVVTHRIALGYAKANKYCHVYQDDGLHVAITDYDGDEPPDDPLQRRLYNLQEQLWYANKDWPFYSGGGAGTTRPLEGDFVAEVDYTTTRVGQASTLEMAAVNVDPGAHQPPWQPDGTTPRLPRTIRDKDSFYDPHGAPPFVGVEHDENDGYRINWNLGVEYDNNQYGRPVGDGTALGARLRLERRGPYFSAYYRNQQTNGNWVCVGATRNDTLNPIVHIRCAGKRWRQERDDDPSQYYPIAAVEFVFRNLSIRRIPA
jgi:glycerophosphoryl diester phosphodiesterase